MTRLNPRMRPASSSAISSDQACHYTADFEIDFWGARKLVGFKIFAAASSKVGGTEWFEGPFPVVLRESSMEAEGAYRREFPIPTKHLAAFNRRKLLCTAKSPSDTPKLLRALSAGVSPRSALDPARPE